MTNRSQKRVDVSGKNNPMYKPGKNQAYEAMGAVLKKLRLEAGLSQKELVSKLDIGRSHQTLVSQWEKGQTRVAAEHWAALAKVFEKDPVEFAKVLCMHYEPAIFDLLVTRRSQK